jgi:hypothetical protein
MVTQYYLLYNGHLALLVLTLCAQLNPTRQALVSPFLSWETEAP